MINEDNLINLVNGSRVNVREITGLRMVEFSKLEERIDKIGNPMMTHQADELRDIVKDLIITTHDRFIAEIIKR